MVESAGPNWRSGDIVFIVVISHSYNFYIIIVYLKSVGYSCFLCML